MPRTGRITEIGFIQGQRPHQLGFYFGGELQTSASTAIVISFGHHLFLCSTAPPLTSQYRSTHGSLVSEIDSTWVRDAPQAIPKSIINEARFSTWKLCMYKERADTPNVLSPNPVACETLLLHFLPLLTRRLFP
ncbi:hypothetical protein PAXRUDRAFT_746051 [Paxillus rubicundulus Ve08.2h10]|uniref:Uncharacterized protein n=1 Tax=Paxillus rubicundulus Ve08.2h10 TaxID=930991 RepID=A0A0D0DI30_9AGAM|nr:hypothetical protein PAXRUDRAFT_746051 [Paxillus rubicundulus Ve08.2h10]